MKITLQIQRYNPEADKQPHFKDYQVQVQPTDRVLDALMQVKNYQDGTLAFRKSCAHGVCGSDAMIINGRERLACKTLVQDVAEADGTVVKIEPLKHLPLLRDLMVQQAPFFERFERVKPFLIPAEKTGPGEYIQTPEDREQIDDATKCIDGKS